MLYLPTNRCSDEEIANFASLHRGIDEFITILEEDYHDPT